ncbi:MAG: hypothetical protein R3C12_09480 [Planctomycetaceae bacterium]
MERVVETLLSSLMELTGLFVFIFRASGFTVGLELWNVVVGVVVLFEGWGVVVPDEGI